MRTGDAVPYAALDSAITNPRLRTAARDDVYWAHPWRLATSVAWTSRATHLRHVAAGTAKDRAATPATLPAAAAIERITTRNRARRLDALAAIGMWRAMTHAQLAAMTAHPTLAGPRSRDRDVLWAAGLIEEGMPVRRYGARTPELVRPDPHADFTALADRLCFAERLSVTGGQPWKWGGQWDRHNVLSTELGLRVAEWCDVGAVLGESMAGLDLLMGGQGTSGAGTRTGDMVIVRSDGLRIVVEMTATITSHFRRKVARWVSLLAGRRERDTAVVFVEIPHPDHAGAAAKVQRHLREAITESLRADLSATVNGVDELIAVARWHDWFPSTGTVTPTFPALPALRPTGIKGDPWQTAELLDPVDLPAPPDLPAAAVLANMAHLRGIPPWLRTTPPADLAPWLATA